MIPREKLEKLGEASFGTAMMKRLHLKRTSTLFRNSLMTKK
jgi:hypothetical protein